MGFFDWLFGKQEAAPVQKPVLPQIEEKLFNENDPMEICKIVNALSTLVTNVGEISTVSVLLHNDDPSKGWVKEMNVQASIDNWRAKKCQNDQATYEKLGLSASEAKYLAIVPFSIDGDSIEYNFKVVPENPPAYKNIIMDEMRKGTAKSRFAGNREIRIEYNNGLAICTAD